MLALVRALGRSRPCGRCRKAPHVGDFEARIQRDNNDASSITDLSSSRRRIENKSAADTFTPLGFDRHQPLIVSRMLNETSMADRFERWIVERGRHYKDVSEKQRRFEIFKSNVEYIEYFNAGNHMYWLGINNFTDLTNEEVTAWCTGYIPPDEDKDFGHMDSSSDEDEDFGHMDSSSKDKSLV
ncbi:chymopapain-like [Dioscorea cayenensis subsp. rotundata]|uniref:Chymopapain-like n=1 Tax=Dioscorea cayennensis subsp. rotundata TaxID=55577 RepID=A0AB40CZ14_DIOCR|nr:chymopapain-like [Dioscorea cayenensis subsp. rotundata]